MKEMYVYSGLCRVGLVGQKTSLSDDREQPLFVGDIVECFVIDQFGICDSYGLTAVVSDQFESFSDGSHREKQGEITHFVMGIKGVDFNGIDKEKWIVKKVKSFNDVIVGEKWPAYGFNYQDK